MKCKARRPIRSGRQVPPARRRAGAVLACGLIGAAAWGCAPAESRHAVAVGTLERDRIELVAEDSERILEIAVIEGDVVAAGDLVARLDDALRQARLAAAEATRDGASARLRELLRGARSEDVEEARATLREAASALRQARRDLARARELEAQGVDSPARLDAATAAEEEARARRAAAEAVLERLVKGTTIEELDRARAEVARAEADVTAARLLAGRLSVRAPRAGRVDALPWEVGERPPAGATIAVLLADGAPHARVHVPEALRARLATGSRASVEVAGVAGSFAGTVSTISAEAAFTPYHALTERDRGRLSYVAEVILPGDRAADLPTGVPVEVRFEAPASP